MLLGCPGCRQRAKPADRKDASTQPAAASQPAIWVGLRRSSYGLPAKNADHEWWAGRAKSFAANFPNARPVIIEIVSGYQYADGSTEFEFARPADLAGPAENISFRQGPLDHEQALRTYEARGVKAIIQVEPGSAGVARCLEIAYHKFGRHPCVIGYGVDAEWYLNKESPDRAGRPVSDADAKRWMETVASFKSANNLFLKHWDPKHMPPSYRHDGLWFLTDSQAFAGRAEMLADFRAWAGAFKGGATGYQFGYPNDRRWWSRLANPPADLGRAVRQEIPDCRYLIWVDFTAAKVEFGAAGAAK